MFYCAIQGSIKRKKTNYARIVSVKFDANNYSGYSIVVVAIEVGICVVCTVCTHI